MKYTQFSDRNINLKYHATITISSSKKFKLYHFMSSVSIKCIFLPFSLKYKNKVFMTINYHDLAHDALNEKEATLLQRYNITIVSCNKTFAIIGMII